MRMGIHIVRHLAFAVTLTTVLCLGSVWNPSVTNATVYYTATNGNDANLGTNSQPFRTIRKGVGVLHPGDTLYVRAGTYAETITPSAMTIPSGTSWSNPVTISGYPDETVTIRGIALNTGSNISYVIFDHLVLDDLGWRIGFYVGCGSHHIRLSNSEVKNTGGNGIQFCNNADYNEVINCSVHGSEGHGLYITSSNNLFDGNKVYNNGGFGYHLYRYNGHTVNNNIIRNSEIHGNGFTGGTSAGIIVGCGDNNVVHDNIVRDNMGGITVGWGNPPADNTQVYNNTIYGNTAGGIDLLPGLTKTIVANNTLYENGWGIADWGSIGTVLSNNTEE